MKLIFFTGEKLGKGGLAKAADAISGGLAEKRGKTEKDFPAEAIAAGVKVEMEHTDNPEVAKKIVLDHLTEDPEYYEKLKVVEGKEHEATKKEKVMSKAEFGIDGLSEYLEKAEGGPYIGPRGGKWADAQHTIPWDEKRAQAGKKQVKPREQSDSHAVRELVLFIENDADLHRQMFIPAVKNLVNKMAAGKYDHAQATKLFNYMATEGAKRYAKEFGRPGDEKIVFNPATRMAAAKELADTFHDEATLGNYDKYLNKKNKKAVGTLKEGGGEKKTTEKSFSGIELLAFYAQGQEEDLDYSGDLAKAGEEGEALLKTYTAIRNAYEKEYGPGSWKKIKVSKEAKESKAKPETLSFGSKKKLGPEEHERYTEAKKRLAGKLGMPKTGWGLYGRTILGGLKDKEKRKKKKGEKAEKSMEVGILEEYLEKADQEMGQGKEQGGKLDGVGKTSGSGDSDPGSPVGAPAPKKQRLSEDDAEDEDQMKEHKKPIERTAKSMAIPMNQRDMVAHENAVAVSKLRKGEDDVEVGTGIPTSAQAQSENLEKGRTWNQGADSRVFYSEQADLECEQLMKSDGEFYPMGSPKVTRDSILIHQHVRCSQCQGLMAKSLAVCPHCGAGARSHQVTPIVPPLAVVDASEEIRKSRPGLLRPAKREADVFLPNGVTGDETE